MKNKNGLIHIYCGNGKGKTTAAIGLVLRAAAHGERILIYQFMKDNSSKERELLETLGNVTVIPGLNEEKFSFQMTASEKEERTQFYEKTFIQLVNTVVELDYTFLLLDEVLYAIRAGLFNEELLIEFICNKPAALEIILTGQDPSAKLIELSHYVSEIRKIKHPYDAGIPARSGVEK